MQPTQLRRLHLLWRRWAGKLALPPDRDRQLRHYYIRLITGGQCSETKSLDQRQAAAVIGWLANRVRRRESRQNYVAGTAGRRGYPEQKRVPPSEAAWRALWGCARALGMDRSDVDSFIRRHYSRIGLRGVADLHTMADLNRVLWGLKAMLRHGSSTGNCSGRQPRAA